MERHEREFLISRIDAGYLRYKKNDIVLKIYPPSKDVAYEAQEVYNETLTHCKNLGIFDEIDIFEKMIEYNIWTEQINHDFDILPKNIENLKVGLYNNRYNSILQKDARKYLDVSKQEYDRLFSIRHSWDYLTCTGIASSAKMQFIIENSTYYNEQLYDWSSIRVINVINHYYSSSLSEEIIRELARTDPWGSIWSSRKKSGLIFPEPMTNEQRMLISWTTLYDNIAQSPDYPGDEVAEDDDMLDGWMIIQRKEREKQVLKTEAEKLISNPKIANSDEVFIQVGNEKDAAKIYELNDTHSKAVRKSRLKQLEQKGTVRVQDFADIKRKLQMQLNEKFINQVKKKG